MAVCDITWLWWLSDNYGSNNCGKDYKDRLVTMIWTNRIVLVKNGDHDLNELLRLDYWSLLYQRVGALSISKNFISEYEHETMINKNDIL